VLQSIGYSPVETICTGDWAVANATNGQATYSFGLDDLSVVALFAEYITVQLPNESTPRAFAFNVLDIQQWDGGPIVTTQIDVEKLAGVQLTDSVPVSAADNKIVTLGAKTDASYTGGGGPTSGIALLRGIFDQVRIPATSRALIAPWGTNPAQTAASAADTLYKWGATGTTTVLAILLQNKSGSDVRFAIDKASGPGTFVLADGQFAYIDVGAPISVLHLSTAAQQHVNDDTTAGIVFQAWG
jgi:hypothetical protein